MQKIRTCLWFDTQAESAARFYTGIFKRSKIGAIARYGDVGPMPAGSVMTIEFQIEGQTFVGLNGGPHFKFSPAISFIVDCTLQKDVDYYWDRLAEGGEKGQCAWLKDKFGVSWQIVPRILIKLLRDEDPVKARRVMQAMLQMDRIDIKKLQLAYQG